MVVVAILAAPLSGGMAFHAPGPFPPPDAEPAAAVAPQPPARGLLALYVKDAPFEDFSRLAVTIAAAEVHRAGADADEGWTPVEGADRTVDLLRFRHPEARAHLATVVLPAGKYDAVRLTFTQAEGTLKGNGKPVVLPVVDPVEALAVNFTVGHGVTRLVTDVSLHRSVQHEDDGYTFDPAIAFVRVRYLPADDGRDVERPNPTPTPALGLVARLPKAPA